MLKVGSKFRTFDEFQKALKKYEEQVFNNFWVRDCRTLVTHRRKFPNSPAASARASLKYYFAAISCIHGGKKYESKSRKRRPNTMRQGCRAGFYLKLSKCCEFLEITKMNEEHNHLKSNSPGGVPSTKKVVGNIKDLKFLTTLVGGRKVNPFDEYYECIGALEKTYNNEVNMLFDEEDNVLGIFFQDPEMKQFYSAYPEAVFIESEYCFYEGGPAVCVFLIEDPEGNGVVVAVGMLLREDAGIIDWMVNQFPECNQNCKDIEVVLSKRDCKIKKSFEKVFPRISPHIPVHHFMQQINSDLASKNLNLSSEQIEVAKKYLRELMLTVSQQNYKEVYKQMESNVETSVMKYFKTNWKDILDQWVLYRNINFKYFSNQTKNKVENVWQKLKTVIASFTDLRDFIKSFFSTLYTIRASANSISDLTFINNSNNSAAENSYKQLLTTYAFEKVQVQMITADECNSIERIDPNSILLSTSEGLLEVTETACPCLFRSSLMLPCRHIFKYRTLKKLPLYEDNICSEYWFKSVYEQLPKKCDSAVKEIDDKTSILKNDKIKNINTFCYKLSKLSSKVPADLFEKRLRYIGYLVQRWGDSCDKNDNMQEIDREFAIVDSGTDECVLIKKVEHDCEFLLSNDGVMEILKVEYDQN